MLKKAEAAKRLLFLQRSDRDLGGLGDLGTRKKNGKILKLGLAMPLN